MAPRKKINFLRWEEAAELLTVSENTVRRLVASGQLPAYSSGGRTRIDDDEGQMQLGHDGSFHRTAGV